MTPLSSNRLSLVPFTTEMITDRYLGWLSDPEVNRHSRRLGQSAVSADEAKTYLGNLHKDEQILAILTEPEGQVGNIKYGPIDWDNRRADISILIGERSVWGKGIGTEAISLVSEYLFEELELNRVDAGSRNPAFIKAVLKIGWHIEGVQKERFFTQDGFQDNTLVAFLRTDFQAHNL